MKVSITFLCLAFAVSVSALVGCKDLNGKPVGGYTYAYWDSNNPAQFKVLDLNETNAAAYTISQMYTGSRGTYTQAEFPWLSCFLQIISSKNKEINYVMYNDQTYDTVEQRDKQKVTAHESDGKGGRYGHMKGSLCWDDTSGFWLVHSVPGFPLSHSVRYRNYPLPNWVYMRAQSIYGQWFFCATLPSEEFNKIGMLLQYDYPYIYDYYLSNTTKKKMPEMAAMVDGKYIKGYYNQTLTSMNGVKYIAFGKNFATNSDLYEDYIAPALGTSLKTQTWCGGTFGFQCMPSRCQGAPIEDPSDPQQDKATYDFDVVNIRNVSFAKDLWVSNEYEHSKFAIAYSRRGTPRIKWVCASDINRQISQRKRGGGALCFENKDIWNTLNKIVSYDDGCERN